jgi:hypothetical protein
MASVIVPIAMRNHHAYAISVFLMWVAIVAYTVLVVLHAWRILAFRAAMAADLANPGPGFGFFTFIADTDVLGTRLAPPTDTIVPRSSARGRLARARIRGAMKRCARPLALPGRAIRERHLIHLGRDRPVGSGACRCARTSRRHPGHPELDRTIDLHATTDPAPGSPSAYRRIFLALQPGDPHVSLPPLALESADVTGIAPEKSLGLYSA